MISLNEILKEFLDSNLNIEQVISKYDIELKITNYNMNNYISLRQVIKMFVDTGLDIYTFVNLYNKLEQEVTNKMCDPLTPYKTDIMKYRMKKWNELLRFNKIYKLKDLIENPISTIV